MFATQIFSIGLRTGIEELIGASVWWYSRGLLLAVNRFRQRVAYANKYLGVSVWATNLFVPMYGQWDMAGRVISLVVRIVQTIIRSLVFIVWALLDFMLLLLYLVSPLFVLWRISTTLLPLLVK